MNPMRRTLISVIGDITLFLASIVGVASVAVLIVGVWGTGTLPLLIFPALLAPPALALLIWTGLDLVTGRAAELTHRWLSRT